MSTAVLFMHGTTPRLMTAVWPSPFYHRWQKPLQYRRMKTADPRLDEHLMRAYGDGDADAFATLYGRHKNAVYRTVLRSVWDKASADELVQDIWMRVIQARSQYRVTAKFTTWLYRIVHNRLVDHYRKHQPDSGLQTDIIASQNPNPEQHHVAEEAQNHILRAVAMLPSDQRTAFLLRAEADCGLDEIADITGAGKETVKSRLRYAYKSLRDVLGGQHDEQP